jgi:hypothetical protein
MKKLREAPHEVVDVFELVLPDVARPPAQVAKRIVDAQVVLDVAA